MKIAFASVLPSIALLFASSGAWADQIQVQVTAPPPPMIVQPPPPAMMGPVFERPIFPRFRWGWSLEGGPFFFNGTGGLGGATVRAGAQITPLFAVYGQAGGFLGGGAAISNTNASAEVIAAATFGAIGEVDLGDVFYVGLGPELAAGLVGSDAAGPASATVTESAGAFFGLTGRLGVVLGRTRPYRRSGFQLGVDFHAFFTPGGVVAAPMIALGYEAF